VVVIDRDQEKIRRVQNTLDVQAIHGSGGSMSLLRQAGLLKNSGASGGVKSCTRLFLH
jgi:Trk K+ transport system NAD-binding subunit